MNLKWTNKKEQREYYSSISFFEIAFVIFDLTKIKKITQILKWDRFTVMVRQSLLVRLNIHLLFVLTYNQRPITKLNQRNLAQQSTAISKSSPTKKSAPQWAALTNSMNWILFTQLSNRPLFVNANKYQTPT